MVGVIVTPNELVFTFGGYLCQFWWKSIKKCDRESAHWQIHWQTDANWFYNLSLTEFKISRTSRPKC